MSDKYLIAVQFQKTYKQAQICHYLNDDGSFCGRPITIPGKFVCCYAHNHLFEKAALYAQCILIEKDLIHKLCLMVIAFRRIRVTREIELTNKVLSCVEDLLKIAPKNIVDFILNCILHSSEEYTLYFGKHGEIIYGPKVLQFWEVSPTILPRTIIKARI